MRFLTMCKLVVDKIRKTYGTNEVLKEVSLTANAGDVVVIIGSSGSGKSTFLRCINFLEKPDSGTVSLDTVQAWGFSLSGQRSAYLSN